MKVIQRTDGEIRQEIRANKAVSDAQAVKGEDTERNDRVNALIRERYSLSEELALTRHAMAKIIAGEPVPEEYAAFNAYVEECKAKAGEVHE